MDFTDARFADHVDGYNAMKRDDGLWITSDGVEKDDQTMLDEGWEVVVERDSEEIAELETIVATVTAQKVVLENKLSEPVALKVADLEEVWENAEVHTPETPPREGDFAISAVGVGDEREYLFFVVHGDFQLGSSTRILIRDTRPEGAGDIESVLEGIGSLGIGDRAMIANVLATSGLYVKK